MHDDFFAGHADGIKGVTAEEQMAGKGRDVKALLAQQKRAILDGCRIVFSGVFPITENRPPESHYLWKLTAELGATPSLTLTNFPLTHLVIHPARLGTQKHNQVRERSLLAFAVGYRCKSLTCAGVRRERCRTCSW